MNKIIALFTLILLSPLLLIVAIIILLDDGYPFFHLQKRVGKNNIEFKMIKFRTMRINTPILPTDLLNQPSLYINKSGYFLRKYSIDEIPNLINVLQGDMSFVGPRPATSKQSELLSLRNDLGIEKLKPGITGWAQINGRDNISLEKKIGLEKEYLGRKSKLFDLYILLRTLPYILTGNGVKS